MQKSGCVDVLTQDELRRQLTAEGGLHCSKRPSHEAHFPMTASHTTSLNVQASNKKVDGYRIHKLVWTTVKGESKSADDVRRVVASMTAPSVLLVHRASTAPLQFDVGVFFRDPLVDLLTMLCTGRPLEAGKALEGVESGDRYTVGQRLELRLAEADPINGSLRFELPDTPPSRGGPVKRDRTRPGSRTHRGRPVNIRHIGSKRGKHKR